MAASSGFGSTYQWEGDFVIRIAPGMKNVVSLAQLSCNLRNIRLNLLQDRATRTIGVGKHPQFCRKPRKNGSAV
jgi:hypothetical protein